MAHTKDEALKLAQSAFKDIASETYDTGTNGEKAQRIAEAALPIIEQALKDQPRLIGWRTDDYLMETSDMDKAKNWGVHHNMLPIFEGDKNTKLVSPMVFKIYKPIAPLLSVPNVQDGELPWVYDQDPSSGNVASMWVMPVNRL
jgi:hypothetical protein